MFSRSLEVLALCGFLSTSAFLQLAAAQDYDVLRRLRQRDEQFALDAAAPRALHTRSKHRTAGPGTQVSILVTSDSHGAGKDRWSFLKTHPLPPADVLIHAGDVTDEGRLEEYEAVVPYLMKHPAKVKIFIGGNHDFTLDEPYFKKFAQGGDVGDNGNNPVPKKLRSDKPGDIEHTIKTAKEFFTNPAAAKAGVKLLPEGMHDIQVKTSENHNVRFKVFASPYTPWFNNYAFAYKAKTEKRFNQKGAKHYIPDGHAGPQIMITHGPPEGILDKTTAGANAGDPNLLEAVKRVKPLVHVFGHVHEAAGVLRMQWGAGKDGGKRVPVADNTIDLRKPGQKLVKGKSTLFLNVAQREGNKNTRPWKLIKLRLVGAAKGKHWVDNNDPDKKPPKTKLGKKIHDKFGKVDKGGSAN